VNDPSESSVIEMIRDDAFIRLCPRKWNEINQPLGRPTVIKRLKVSKVSGPERYFEQGPETSTKESDDNLSHESV
jgi:hypothetical protein